MRLVTVQKDGQPVLGFQWEGDVFTFAAAAEALGGWHNAGVQACGVEPAAFAHILAFLDAGPGAWQAAQRLIQRFQELPAHRRAQARCGGVLLAPIPRPRKNIICVGRNYVEHAHERGAQAPKDPVFFTKAPTAVAPPEAVIPYPPATSQLDFEGELAVVIGRQGRDIAPHEAYDYVFGYTIINDLTARDLQQRHQQWFRGKSLDGSCPMGPVIVTRDELGDARNLTLETRVNGQLRQSARTDQMIFDIPTLIAVLSDGMTLEPGDIIAAGTPAGVGAADGRFLNPGDRVEVTVSGIGTLAVTIGQREAR